MKTCPAPKVSTTEAKKPPIKLAIEEESIQTAIKIEANFGGDNLVTTERPTGDKQSSPKVITKSAKVNTFNEVIPESVAKNLVAKST